MSKYEQRKALTRMIIALFIIVVFVTGVIIYLPQIILKIVSLNAVLNSEQTSVNNSKKDKIAPFPPQFDPLPSATSKKTITLTGYAEAEVSVKLYRNNSFLKTTVSDREGIFTFADVMLVKGENAFYATAVDRAGNESKDSVTQIVDFKNVGPDLYVEATPDTEKGSVIVQGTTDTDAKVTINGRRTVVKRDGSFSVQYKLEPGENSFEAVAVDSAGNEARQTVSVNFDPEE